MNANGEWRIENCDDCEFRIAVYYTAYGYFASAKHTHSHILAIAVVAVNCSGGSNTRTTASAVRCLKIGASGKSIFILIKMCVDM